MRVKFDIKVDLKVIGFIINCIAWLIVLIELNPIQTFSASLAIFMFIGYTLTGLIWSWNK